MLKVMEEKITTSLEKKFIPNHQKRINSQTKLMFIKLMKFGV